MRLEAASDARRFVSRADDDISSSAAIDAGEEGSLDASLAAANDATDADAADQDIF